MKSYGALCTRFYDLDKPQAPEEGLRFYLPYLDAAAGPALELMCGSGRYLEPFLAAGHDVDGADASADMLAACRDRILPRWPNAGIYQQRITALGLPRSYRLVVITSGSFSLLIDPPEIASALDNCFAALQPGGTFVTEVEGFEPTRASGLATHRRTVATPEGGEIALSSRSEYDATRRIETAHSQYVWRQNGKTNGEEDEELHLRYYAEDEFSALLAAAGFTAITCTYAYPDTEVEQMGGVLLFECKRPG